VDNVDTTQVMENKTQPDERFYSITELAKILGLQYKTVQRIIRSGELVAYRVRPRTYRISRTNIDQFLEQVKTTGQKNWR